MSPKRPGRRSLLETTLSSVLVVNRGFDLSIQSSLQRVRAIALLRRERGCMWCAFGVNMLVCSVLVGPEKSCGEWVHDSRVPRSDDFGACSLDYSHFGHYW